MVTATLKISNKKGEQFPCRALLDTCSTANFMTEELASRLGLDRETCHISVGALDALKTTTKGLVSTTIHSRINGFQRKLTFLTVKTISDAVPDQPIYRGRIKIPKNLELADPNFHIPAPIDILIGVGSVLASLCIGQIDAARENGTDLFLQKTQFGWIIGGTAPTASPPHNRVCNLTRDLHFDLTSFWNIEEVSTHSKVRTQDELLCETHFLENLNRDLQGRYIVALPFNEKKSQLGESRIQAEKRLSFLERKLARNTTLKQEYHKVLQEYIDMGHMSEVEPQRTGDTRYYLPHHAVLKESSTTTAVRVVFDGSAKTTTNISLNDTLRTGPTIQNDLFTLLIRFRKHSIVITGDIEKMYRQFLIRKEDRKFQSILWRKSPHEPVKTYELNTVTFGLSAAPFLAIRCLHKLAEDEQKTFPLATNVLINDFYVDDLLTGSSSPQKVKKLRIELEKLLSKAGLNIRKWASNSLEVLKGVPANNINQQLLLDESHTIKTLGVKWNAASDTLIYTVKSIELSPKITKRTVLSEIAKIFDPLGLLAPVITTAKIFMQKLWTLQLHWDESLPMHLHTEWCKFYRNLENLDKIEFKRKVIVDQALQVQLHGFSDASERAYGACIYIRSVDKVGKIQTTLLCSKSRVAPVKVISIPRLELCGAVLLTTLMENVKEALKIEIENFFYWTDSTIVLHWLHTNTQSLKTFVANRVSEIQRKTSLNEWQHIRTKENPADLVSRGLPPEQFQISALWSEGPSWLKLDEKSWPAPIDIFQQRLSDEILEKRNIQCFMHTPQGSEILTRFSSIHKLQRFVAYCWRFKTHKKGKPAGILSLTELRQSLQIIIREVQRDAFHDEIRTLTKGQPIAQQSRLITLHPFLDRERLLRVGGRLKNADLPFSQQHPLLLPKNHSITQLLIEEEHRLHLHAGIQTTLYALRRQYWILDGRNAVRKVVRNCITCRKLQPLSIEYLMGDLPKDRVTTSRPFSKVGVDYCGPFFIKEKKHRNRNKLKIYVAIFVCFSVKAVHIEIVSDLTTDAFLGALKRFTARRGICSDIYSDNGTNFVGARNELKEMYEFLHSKENQKRLEFSTQKIGIRWHFIPARAPNFGGLWEASVKSFKHHLRRVVGNTLLTYEEFQTFATEVEAILNSRPLTPISSDPNDLLVLTPGHFLIGDSLTSLPEQDLREISNNRLSNWQHVQQMRQHFWARWSREYISELTVRHKWTIDQPSIQKGAIVLVKEDNLPPLQWVMGRIVELHPGSDGVSRVVSIKTPHNIIKRSVKKIAPLPIQAKEK